MGFWAQDNAEQFLENAFKSPEDMFRFSCKMCGQCCRNRPEPVLVNGADIFRMAKALGLSTSEFMAKNTTYYLGENSHAPVAVLNERLDGSCRMLRKGKCMVHADKPAVCALHPLGRMQDIRTGEMTYFLIPHVCRNGEGGREWTLREWIDAFHLEETEKMSAAWNSLFGGIFKVTCKMKPEKISKDMELAMLGALYFNYDTSEPFEAQVERNKQLIRKWFLEGMGIALTF